MKIHFHEEITQFWNQVTGEDDNLQNYYKDLVDEFEDYAESLLMSNQTEILLDQVSSRSSDKCKTFLL